MDPKSVSPQRQPQSAPPTRDGASLHNMAQQQDRQRDTALSLVRSDIEAYYRNRAAQTGQAVNLPGHAATGHTAQPANTAQPATTQYTTAQPTAVSTAHTATNSQARAAAPPAQTHVNQEQWKQYHSAWQHYYQKYYEQYYVNEMSKNIAAQHTNARKRFLGSAAANFASAHAEGQATNSAEPHSNTPKGAMTRNQALAKIRQNIIDKAQQSATKVRKSRHFIPISAALTVAAVAILLQYNQVLVANVKAYVTPSNQQAQNIIIDPNTDVPVGPENKMIIPKINVDAPIVMNVGPSEKEQLDAMANGIAHVRYPGASAVPGQVGNTVFSAHSSSDWSDTGAYKFIFVQLERLVKDDVIYINYDSKRYAYKVYETKVVTPDNIQSLHYTGNDPILTLITCTPLGTAHKRFLVFAKQISPDPAGAEKPAPASSQPATTPQMAGTNPTLIERLFGAR